MRRRSILSLLGLLFVPLLGTSAFAEESPWPNLDPADVARSDCDFEVGAPAEILQKTTVIDHLASTKKLWSSRSCFVRVKVYSEEGVRAFGTIEIPFTSDLEVSRVRARVVHPDGETVEIATEAVFDRDIVRHGDRFAGVKVVVIPALGPGDIVDYRWVEDDALPDGVFEILEFYDDYPVPDLRFEVKGIAFSGAPPLWWEAVNMPSPPREVSPRGTTLFHGTALPSVRREPFMPPVNSLASWLFVYYAKRAGLGLAERWDERARELDEDFDRKLGKDDLGPVAREATEGLSAPRDVLARLHDFCRNRIRNLDESGRRDEDAGGAKLRRPAKVLESGEGTAQEIRLVFAGLARSLGFESHLVELSSRRRFLLNRDFGWPELLDGYAVAVSLPDGWVFTDPGTPALPPLRLPWWNQGATALLADPERARFVEPPQETASVNRRTIRADLTLEESGSLAGPVSVEFEGQESLRWLLAHGPEREDVERALTEWLREEAPGVEVRDLRCTPWPTDTLRVRADLEWPAGARPVGRTLLLAPLLFGAADDDPFPDPERRYPVVFPFASTALDSMVIHLPDGFAPVSADTAVSFELGPVASHSIRLQTVGRDVVAIHESSLRSTRFEVAAYPALREFYGKIREADRAQVVLRRP